jgi:hypothetical protein
MATCQVIFGSTASTENHIDVLAIHTHTHTYMARFSFVHIYLTTLHILLLEDINHLIKL